MINEASFVSIIAKSENAIKEGKIPELRENEIALIKLSPYKMDEYLKATDCYRVVTPEYAKLRLQVYKFLQSYLQEE